MSVIKKIKYGEQNVCTHTGIYMLGNNRVILYKTVVNKCYFVECITTCLHFISTLRTCILKETTQ